MTSSHAVLLRNAAFIGGSWLAAGSREGDEVRNPADGSLVGTVPHLGAEAAHRAVEAAKVALVAWSARSGRDRAKVMRAIHDLVLDRADDLALIMTLEQGKPLAQARAEIVYGATYFEWFAEEAPRIGGTVHTGSQGDKDITVLREPVGVTAAITPWNFPFVSVARKLAPALAAGCTQVLKPAPQTPLTALALAALCESAGLPPGVFNVITGNSEAIGAVLTSHPAVRLLTFTGSTAVGKTLFAACAGTVKKLSLELGGHAPFIVFADADLDAAVSGLIACKFRNMGQVCIAANRVFVEDSIFDAFTERLVVRVSAMTVGPGWLDAVDQGPLTNREVFDKVSRHVNEALAVGARAVCGGSGHELGGLFYRPTVLVDVPEGTAIDREETFGPVAPLFRFSAEAEVLARANDTPFGLAAYVYTRDVDRVRRVTRGLHVGMVGVNTGLIGAADAPFGGIKESGVGREGSRLGLEEFLEPKYICSANPASFQ